MFDFEKAIASVQAATIAQPVKPVAKRTRTRTVANKPVVKSAVTLAAIGLSLAERHNIADERMRKEMRNRGWR